MLRSARKCWSGPPAMPADRTGCRRSTSNRWPSTRTIRPAARCAASAPINRRLPSKSCSNRLAEKVGIDGWEIRWRNILQQGDRFATGQKLDKPFGLKETLLAVKDAYRGAKYAGIACGIKNVRHRQRHARSGQGVAASRARRQSEHPHRLHRNGPGPVHGYDSNRGAKKPACRRRRSRPRPIRQSIWIAARPPAAAARCLVVQCGDRCGQETEGRFGQRQNAQRSNRPGISRRMDLQLHASSSGANVPTSRKRT